MNEKTNTCRLGDLVSLLLGFELRSKKENFPLAPIISVMVGYPVNYLDSRIVESCKRALADTFPFLEDTTFKRAVGELSGVIRDDSPVSEMKRYVSQWLVEQEEKYGDAFPLPLPEHGVFVSRGPQSGQSVILTFRGLISSKN